MDTDHGVFGCRLRLPTVANHNRPQSITVEFRPSGTRASARRLCAPQRRNVPFTAATTVLKRTGCLGLNFCIVQKRDESAFPAKVLRANSYIEFFARQHPAQLELDLCFLSSRIYPPHSQSRVRVLSAAADTTDHMARDFGGTAEHPHLLRNDAL